MSQIYKAGVAGTPSVPTQVTTDDGVAVPVANNLNIVGDNGIITEGAGDTVTVKFNEGSDTTVGATTVTLLTITPDDSATTTYQILIDGYDAINDIGVGGQIVGTVRKSGGVVVVIPTPDKIKNGDAAIIGADYNLVASGADVLVQATGVAGLTISWKAITAGVT